MLKLLIILFLFAYPVFANAHECSKDILPHVVINKSPLNVSYDFDMTLLDLTNYAINKNNNNPKKNKELSSKNIVIRGLTSSQFYHKIHVNFQYDKQDDNSYCIYPQNIIIDVGFKPFTVFIEKEYKNKGCQHDAILEHENKHVKIMSVVSNYYISQMKTAILKKYYEFYGQSIMNISDEQLLIKPISLILKPYLDKIEEQVTELNSKLDSPESLNYTKNECKIWYLPFNNMKEVL